jgi:uncharacterized damage-inducible protein DinB
MEPWLSGSVPHADPIVRAVLHGFEQVRHDLAKWTAGIAEARLWERVGNVAPLGFQLRHIAGSVDRLTTYALGGELSEAQLAALRAENEAGATLDELLREVDASLARSGEAIAKLTNHAEPRFVGRKRLPTTVGGLLVHIAEHTQRHLGETIVTCKLLKE